MDPLATAVIDRLAPLGAETLDVLRAAASLGPEFTRADLAAALDHRVESPALAAAVQAAIAAGVLDPDPDGGRLRFRRGLLRQALISGSNPRRSS